MVSLSTIHIGSYWGFTVTYVIRAGSGATLIWIFKYTNFVLHLYEKNGWYVQFEPIPVVWAIPILTWRCMNCIISDSVNKLFTGLLFWKTY